MVRRGFDRGDVLVCGEEFHLLRRRDMQHVDALAGLVSQPHQPLRAYQRSIDVAPDRMRPRIARDAQTLPFAQAVFVFGMEGGAAMDELENIPHTAVVFHQQVAGG